MPVENAEYAEKIEELEARLLEAQRQLELCKQQREVFMYNASHDLQAPLRKLVTFSDRLVTKSRDILDKDSLEYLKRIQLTAEGMRNLVDALGEIANLSEGGFHRCDLDELLSTVLRDLSPLIEKSGAKITVSKMPSIEANAEQLKIVFRELIENAIKFREPDRPLQIAIGCRKDGPERIETNNGEEVYLRIEVADNGIGFLQKNAATILEPFQRLHSKAEYPGNGLGLALCQKIINMHRGKIYAEGNEDVGSVFALVLPEIHRH